MTSAIATFPFTLPKAIAVFNPISTKSDRLKITNHRNSDRLSNFKKAITIPQIL
jgi:hypothetical protein